jgi:AraC family L-rhamnose operon regulatory protein RhaS
VNLSKQNVTKFEAPKRKGFSYWHEETRFDLPFPDTYDNFLYITKFWNEKWYIPNQYHDHFEVCYVCEGYGWFMLEGMLQPVKKGDIFITKPGEIHCGGASIDSTFLVYAVGFRFEQLGELEKGLYKLGIDRISNDADEQVRPYFDQMMAEIETGVPYAHIMVQSCLTAALTLILRIYERQHDLPKMVMNSLTPEIMNVLNLVHSDTNYNGKIDEIAAKIHISRAHLDREFKHQMGVKLGEYLRGVWVERAKQLIRQSHESVTRIAEILQFDTIQAFCVFFKRQSGLSPQEFRKRNTASGTEPETHDAGV